MSLYDKANKIFKEKYGATYYQGGREEIVSRQVKAVLEAVETEMDQLEKRIIHMIQNVDRNP